MAESSYPFDNANTTETQYSELFKRLQDSGVWAGSDPDELKVIPDAGLALTVNPGFGYIRGHVYINDAPLSVAVDAGDANPRIDLIILRLDPTANSVTATVLKGSPLASPVAPALAQTGAGIYEMELARVAVAASTASIGSGNITDNRPYMGTANGFWTTSRRPTTPRLGKQGFNVTLGYSEEWDGTAWKPAGQPDLIDATTLNGRKIYDGTVAPIAAFGNDGDLFAVWLA